HYLSHHASLFLKFLILSQPHLPPLTEVALEATLYLLNKEVIWNPRTAEKIIWKNLLLPYVDSYKEASGFISPRLRHEQQSINYLAASLFVNIKVNVQEHFTPMLSRYKIIIVYLLIYLSDTSI